MDESTEVQPLRLKAPVMERDHLLDDYGQCWCMPEPNVDSDGYICGWIHRQVH